MFEVCSWVLYCICVTCCALSSIQRLGIELGRQIDVCFVSYHWECIWCSRALLRGIAECCWCQHLQSLGSQQQRMLHSRHVSHMVVLCAIFKLFVRLREINLSDLTWLFKCVLQLYWSVGVHNALVNSFKNVRNCPCLCVCVCACVLIPFMIAIHRRMVRDCVWSYHHFLHFVCRQRN